MSRRVLLCATDAGGAANLGPLVPVIRARGWQPRIVTRESLRRLFGDDDRDLVPEADVAAGADALIERERPDAIVAGTTCFDSIDRRIVAAARRSGVRSTVVLDERYDYASRFTVDGAPCWPDAITVIDEASIEEAAGEGVPRAICHVTGSPALAALAARVRSLDVGDAPRPASLSGLPDWPILVFISETIADDYGRTAAGGPMGPFAGFTEETVLAELMTALPATGPLILVNKLHPAASATENPVLRMDRMIVVTPEAGESLWQFLRAAHAAIGMRSIGLVEAALLGVPAISFQPGGAGSERSTAVRLGLMRRLDSVTAVADWCRGVVRAPRVRATPPDVSAARDGAVDRVLGMALTRTS